MLNASCSDPYEGYPQLMCHNAWNSNLKRLGLGLKGEASLSGFQMRQELPPAATLRHVGQFARTYYITIHYVVQYGNSTV